MGAGWMRAGGHAQSGTSAAGSGGQRRPREASRDEVTPSACPVGPLAPPPTPGQVRRDVTWEGAPEVVWPRRPLRSENRASRRHSAPRTPLAASWGAPRLVLSLALVASGLTSFPPWREGFALSHFPVKSKTPLSSPGGSGQGARRWRWSAHGLPGGHREPSIGMVGRPESHAGTGLPPGREQKWTEPVLSRPPVFLCDA